MCLLITGCTNQNIETVPKSTEMIGTTRELEETTVTTEIISTQEESKEEKETLLWTDMSTEEKWAYRFMRKYESYENRESLLYDIDHDGYMELILRYDCEWWGQYNYTVLDIFEESVSFNKTFEAQTYYEPTYQGETLCYFLMKGLPFSLYYDSVNKEFFYIGEVWFCGFKGDTEEIFVNRYDILGEEIREKTIAHYVYTKKESEGEKIYIVENGVNGNSVLEKGAYLKNELYQLLGINDYLANYELVSDNIFEDSNWKPLRERQKDLAECAKNYPVTVD